MSVKVSVSCTSYNQEKYIKQTLESLLMQKTNFDFEILIHDDASTDSTVEIIKEYEKIYPKIIKPIYQNENQYSKNIDINYVFNFSRAKGKYLAFCEADDYWTDPYKLQKQFDFLETHPNVSACVHAAKSINEQGTRILDIKRVHHSDLYLKTDNIISLQGNIISNSVLMRNYFTKDFKMPEWYFEVGVTDYPLFLILSTKGDIYYMNDVMSVYRIASINSWTQRILYNPENRINHIQEMIYLLESFNDDTHYVFNDNIKKQINHNKTDYLLADKSIIKKNPKEYKIIYQSLPLKRKIKLNISFYLPAVVNIYRRIKNSRMLNMLKTKEVFPIKYN